MTTNETIHVLTTNPCQGCGCSYMRYEDGVLACEKCDRLTAIGVSL